MHSGNESGQATNRTELTSKIEGSTQQRKLLAERITRSPEEDTAKKIDQPHSSGTLSLFSSGAFLTILFGHFSVDVYSFMIPPSLGVVQQSFALTPEVAAWLLGAGSLASGLAQPTFAFLSDWTDRRIFGAVGIAIAATFLCLLGFANGPLTLFVIYIIGMIGVGMFHPVAASTIGQISARHRSVSVSLFFVAGMLGGMTGSVVGSRIISSFGLKSLIWLIAPGLILAVLLNRGISKVPHRHHDFKTAATKIGLRGARWTSISILYVASSIRFMVNMGLVYLLVRLFENRVASQNPELDQQEVARLAAPIVGSVNGCMIAGMATGGLLAGIVIRPGREKLPLILIPIFFAPAIYLFPQFVGLAGLFAFLAGIGFSSMVPTSVAVAQRLLPERTSLASGLILGGAWAVALIGPRLAEFIESSYGIERAFAVFALLLFSSGLVILPLRNSLVKQASQWS